VEQQDAEQGALLRRRNRDHVAVAPNLQRAEDAELERSHV
jgi:hypothetical protein